MKQKKKTSTTSNGIYQKKKDHLALPIKIIRSLLISPLKLLDSRWPVYSTNFNIEKNLIAEEETDYDIKNNMTFPKTISTKIF